jgi:hypothetical protein
VFASLVSPPPTLAGDIEEFVCDWLEEDTVCSGDQTLSDDFLDALVGEVIVQAPGCHVFGVDGVVQVTNNFDSLRIKVEMSGDFSNPTQLPDECGPGCGQAGNDCECHADHQGLITVAPGTTQSVSCSLPTCLDCSNTCGNDPGECPFGDVYCTVPSNVVIKLKAVSCDGGSTWTVLNTNQIVDLDWTPVTPCED